MTNVFKNISPGRFVNRKKLIVIIIIVSIVAMAYTLILPNFINLEQYRSQIFSELSKKIKYKLSIGKMSVDLPLTGNVVIKSKFVELKKKDGTPILYGEDVKIGIAILPVLYNEIVIKRLYAKNFSINISKKNKGNFDIEDLIPHKNPNDKFKIKFIDTKALIRDYNINIINKYTLPLESYNISGPKLRVLNFTEDKYLRFDAEGKLNGLTPFKLSSGIKLPFKKDLLSNNYNFGGEINNLNLLSFSKYLKNKVLSGIIDSEFTFKQNNNELKINLNTQIKKDLVIPNYKVNIKSGSFKIKTSVNKDKVDIKEISTNLNSVKSNINGYINNWQSKKPIYSLNIIIPEFSINNLPGILPDFLITPKLFKIIESGNINGITALNLGLDNTSGTLNLSGQAEFKKYSLRLPNNIILNNINSKILFIKDKIHITNFQLSTNKTNLIKINGKYNFLKQYFDKINIKSNAQDLNDLKNILISTTSELNIPNKFMNTFNIGGKADIDLTLSGLINNLMPYGKIKFINVKLSDPKNKLLVDNINGLSTFNNDVSVNDITCNLENNKVNLSGKVNLNSTGTIFIKIPDFKLNTLKDLASKIDYLDHKQKNILKNTTISGSINTDLTLKLNNKKVATQGIVKFNDAKLLNHNLFGLIEIPYGIVKLDNNNLYINNLPANIGKSLFMVNGKIQHLDTKSPDYSIEFFNKNLNLKDFKHIVRKLSLPKDIEKLIESINQSSGLVKFKLTGSRDNYQLALGLNNFNLLLNELINPFENTTGQVVFGKDFMTLTNFVTNYHGSSVKAHGKIHNFDTPNINLSINGMISPLDFKELMPTDISEQLIFSEPLRFKGSAKGNLKNWDIKLASRVPPEAKIAIKGIFQKPEDLGLRFIMNGKGTDKSLDLENISFKIGKTELKATGKLSLSPIDFIYIDNFHLEMPEIDLDNLSSFIDKELLPEKVTGQLKSDIKVNGSVLNPDILGFINLINVNLPLSNTKNLNANIILNGKNADINNLSMSIKDTKFKMSSHIDSLMQLPFELSNLKIYSSSVKLSDLLSSISVKTKQANLVPIVIKNGFIRVDDAVIDKLITTNLNGNIFLCSNGLLQINNLSFDSAGGNTKGNIYYNLFNQTMGAQLKIVGVKANAVATVLLNLPNEVFGDMNGIINYDTKGETYEEFLENSQGNANLAIINGKFSRLGTLEHLLTATNIINGGITGLSLNNILASVIPMHTGQFKLFSGDFSVDKGVLSTNNLSTRGVNLSLEMSGNYNMTSEKANLKMIGTLSQNVSGLLGAIGKLNINTLTDFIPGLGFIPGVSKKKGILYYIPILGSLPFFGGSKDTKVRRFSVDLKGNLYDPSSVKNFQWIRE